MKTLLWTRIDKGCSSGLHSPKLDGDAGFDLECAYDVLLTAGGHFDVHTNVRVKLPEDCWGEIRARSSIAKRGLQVAATIIDNGYTGPLFVMMYNTNRKQSNERETDWLGSIEIDAGQRIAQLVLHQGVKAEAHEINNLVDDPRRGNAGFGSTGV